MGRTNHCKYQLSIKVNFCMYFGHFNMDNLGGPRSESTFVCNCMALLSDNDFGEFVNEFYTLLPRLHSPPESRFCVRDSLLEQKRTNQHNFFSSAHQKPTKEDFEESFAGLEDTKSEHNSPRHQVVEETEISMSDQIQVESMAQDHDDFLNSLDDEPGLNGGVPLSFGVDEVPDKRKMVNGHVSKTYTKTVSIERDYQKIITDNSFISGPPKQGR